MTTVVLVQQGGTGANSAAGARDALGAVANTGGTITGQLNLTGSGVALNVANNVFFGSNVAIGRQVENFPLYVERATLGVTGVFINEDGTANPRLVVYGNANGSVIQHTYSSGADSLLFSIGGSIGDGSEAMRIDSNRNVGIGTTNPTTRLEVGGSITVSDNLYVNGNIYLQGNTTYINVATLNIADPLLYLAANNELTDTVDIGFMGGKNTSGTYSHTGLARDATDGKWKLFDGLPEEDHVGNVINFANSYPATLSANVEANTLTVVNGVSGNVNFDSGTLFVDSVNNRVGVGTDTPAYPLQVRRAGGAGSLGISIDGVGSTDRAVQYFAIQDSAAGVGAGHAFYYRAPSSTTDTLGLLLTEGGNIGVGTTNPIGNVTVSNSGASGLELFHSGAVGSGPYIQAYNRSTSAYMHLTNYALSHTWYVSGTRAIDLDSSGRVGIGTSSPTSKLHVVNGRTDLTGENETYALGVRYGSSAGIYYIGATNSATPDLVFSQVGGAERMRLTNGGELTIGGTTASGTVTSIRSFGNSAAINFCARAEGTAQGQLAGYSFFPTFVGTGDNIPRRAADIWAGFNGGNWNTQYLAFGVGFDGNDVANTTPERMRITATGVGIGNIAPAHRLGVSSSSANTRVISVYNPNATGTYAAIGSQYDYNNSYSGSEVRFINENIAIGTSAIAFATGTNSQTERMRIDSSGNIGIGTSSPTSPLTIFANTTAPLINIATPGNSTNTVFWMEDQDANAAAGSIATMDLAAGLGLFNLYAGAYTVAGANYYGSTRGASRIMLADGGINLYVANTNLAGQTRGTAVTWYQTLASSNTGLIVYTGTGTERMRVSAAGGLSVGTTADPGAGAIYATGDITGFYSDDRLKNKLGNIDNALSKVLSLNGFYFEPNETAINFGYEKKKQVGVSAQEVKAVLPEVVVPAPIDQEYMTVHYHKIVPLLIEAIKELNEKIDKLTK